MRLLVRLFCYLIRARFTFFFLRLRFVVLGTVVDTGSIGVPYTYIFFCMQYNRVFASLFLFLYLDPGFHCHPIWVHVRAGSWDLVYTVEKESIAAITITPTSPDACPAGVGNRNTTNERWPGGLRSPWT